MNKVILKHYQKQKKMKKDEKLNKEKIDYMKQKSDLEHDQFKKKLLNLKYEHD